MHRRRHGWLFVCALFLAACSTDPATPAADMAAPTLSAPSQLDRTFAAAGTEFGVPVSLLKAIGYVETQWQMVRGGSEFEGQAPAFGVMALRGERLERGADLAGVSAEAARSEPEANIRAAAALMSAYADELKIDRTDLGAWASVAARYSGIGDSAKGRELQAYYVHNEVYRVLREGTAVKLEGKLVASLEPLKGRVTPQFAKPPAPQLKAQQQNGSSYYPPLVWRPSLNYSARNSAPIIVIIHTCEGGYSGCVYELTKNTRASAHYVVNEAGSEVSQLVDERRAAWHISAPYRCSLNSYYYCSRNGTWTNGFTIGIEHAGYASGTFSPGMINTSAQLICGISKRNNIALDRFRIVGHGQMQPESRTDPGPNWPWNAYLTKAKEKCGSGGSTTATGTTANTGGYTGPYNLRSGPGTNYSKVGSIGGSVRVSIVCQKAGTSHRGPWGTTSLWDKLSSGKWISDAFVYTGSDGRVAPRCS